MLLGPVADQLGRKRLLIVGQAPWNTCRLGPCRDPSPRKRGLTIPIRISKQIFLTSLWSYQSRDRDLAIGVRNRWCCGVNCLSARFASEQGGSVPIRYSGKRSTSEVRIQESDQRFTRSDKKITGPNSYPLLWSDLRATGPYQFWIVCRSAGTEAELITAMVPRTQSRRRHSTLPRVRATATSPVLGRYQILHFATHSLLNNQHPELSGIVLSLVDEQGQPQDGFLRLHDIYNLNLQADLVVLSACQTRVGKEIKGEGLVGLTRGFMYAGAPRVVASLWKVSDAATAELMRAFLPEDVEGRPAAGGSAPRGSGINVEREAMGGALLLGWLCASGRMAMSSIKEKRGKSESAEPPPRASPVYPNWLWAFSGQVDSSQT